MTIRVEISEREAEILRAVGERLSNAEIAKRFFISVRTVETHVSNLLRKYGVPDRRALAALASTPSHGPGFRGLPVARTPLVGRDGEREALTAALAGARLVTLAGPGGVGKTRLASAVAESFGQGAFIDLVPVRASFLVESVAAGLGVSESPGRPLDQTVLDHLNQAPDGGRNLLVLDNCEHLIDAAASLADQVLTRCPQTTVLATSREPLGIAGEKVLPLGPLPVESAAQALFLQRAAFVDAEFSASPEIVVEICRRLDGMPLAIELAAARSASLGAAGLLAALDDRLRLLTGGRGADERHRSLRDVVGWSYHLLADDERELLRALGIFAGGFDLAAVHAISPAEDRGTVVDLLGRLTAKSLVTRQRGPEARWRMLETVRVFAAEELRAHSELDAVRRRHLLWAEATATRLGSSRTDSWRDEFDLIADDLREAMADSQSHRLARALARLTYARRFFEESIAHFRRAASLAPTPAEAVEDLRCAAACTLMITNLGVRALPILVGAADLASDPDSTAAALARAVEVVVRFSGGLPVETPAAERAELLSRARSALPPGLMDGKVVAQLAIAAAWDRHGQRHDPDPELAAQALAQAQGTGDPLLISAGLDLMATVAARAGRWQEAHRLAAERTRILAGVDRDDPLAGAEIVDCLHMGANYAIAAGDLPAALESGWATLHDKLIGNHPYNSASKLVIALALSGDIAATLEHAEPMQANWSRAGSMTAPWLAAGLLSGALAEGMRGDLERSQWWQQQALIAAKDPAAPVYASFAAFVEARLALHMGHFTKAQDIVDHAFGEFPHGRNQAYAQAAGAELAVVAGLPEAPRLIERASRATAENHWAAACLARAEARLRGDEAGLAQAAAMWERQGARGEHAVTLLLLPDRSEEARETLAALGITTPADH